jgi:transposase-like protein
MLDDSSVKGKNHLFVCYQFLKQLRRRRYGLKPIHTDGAHCYSDACKWWLRLKHYIREIEMKNLMERFIQQIKDRTQNVSRRI